ncbi:type I polyketide synthase [Actinokineospora auranticolor]|uniref:Acyl transferase domain-containing protein n=1 Tax=Actinokineospora auranticolor TaxID=155976 RepID=A0A2S6GLR7_9PSEU|nr:type I polyketide synthase [Actinokineospora auranticolor]PPK66165.1 acyl transferase domain-containing protein [Actinokineospora auranticolor]
MAHARDTATGSPTAPIAVIGLACRLPGAADPERFWDLLRRSAEALRETPPGRWAAARPRPERGGFLDQVDRFDAGFFQVTPRAAAAMDPQQRLALELGWEAVEDAALPAPALRGTDTAVYLGVIGSDYAELSQATDAGPDTTAGLSRGMIANRLSHFLGLRGASMTVDSAQSSALVAVHLAATALARGEARLAIAGGVNLTLGEGTAAALARFGGLSPDGRSHTFDERANGYARGEGGGLVVLKPLAAALADGDRVYCVIRGGAVNNDGATDGLTVPDAHAQERVIRAAHAAAGVSPTEVSYVELHGTGTRVGDPIEAAALGAAFSGARRAPLAVGSAKTNVGHLEGAAGVVGLIKTALALHHGWLPASLNFRAPHPDIPLDRLNLRVVTEPGPWPGPRLAGVSSFGMGGTNCHLVLGDAPAPTPTAPTGVGGPAVAGPVPLLVSGRDAAALRAQAGRLAGALDTVDLGDAAHTLATRRTAFPHRAAVLADDLAQARAGLAALAGDGPSSNLVRGRASTHPTDVVALFPGQGAQRPGMGLALASASPVFAAALDEVARHLDPRLDRPLRDLLAAGDGALDRTEHTQPALFAVEVALFRLVAALGLRPARLVGHSIGEIAAAHVAGVLDLADAADLVIARGRALGALPPGGAMLAVGAGEDRVRALLDGSELDIAAVNGPAAVVVAGAEEGIERLADRARAARLRVKRLATSHAFHSRLMAPALAGFRRVLDGLTFRPPRLTVVSTVTGAEGGLDSPDYWVRHITAPVRFADAVAAACGPGTVGVELGPSAVLTPLARDSAPDAAFLATLRADRPEPDALLSALATAFTRGVELDWSAITPGRPVSLPTYAFQRRRHWVGATPSPRTTDTGPGTDSAAEARPEAPTEGTAAPVLGSAPANALRSALDLVLAQTAAVAGLGDPGEVDRDATFRDLGFDSMASVELRDRIAEAAGVRLAAGLLFDHPTPAAVAAHVRDLLDGHARAAPARTAATTDEPIAIVGMACHYPGGVRSSADLWRLVAAGADAIGPFPEDRGWPADTPLGPDHARVGGFLDGVDRFDAGFFGISPREALAMDPQQRLVLETAWQSLERAGLDPAALRGTDTGVFIGASASDYGPRMHEGNEDVAGHLLTGGAASVLSGRVAYHLGLSGPAVTVDTACSSSLVAVHLAARSLRQGETGLALAGGVAVLATPGMFLEFARQRALSADGRCKAFSADADGTGWAEGVGVLVLERLSDARRLGHRVLAVVRGSAVNSDGASNGLTAPSGPAQQRVIRAALADAGLAPSDVDVLEAHGTGTALGDPIEAEALLATYGSERARPALLGSVKSNIGHTQAAAGVAGVIKLVEAMRHGLVPRTLHADEPTPHVDWSAGALELATAPQPWPVTGAPRRAAVSSFGISGTNAHVVLEHAPEPERTEPGPVDLLPWVVSGRDAEDLRAQAAHLLPAVSGPDAPTPARVAAALGARTRFEHRAVLLADTSEALVAGLTAVAAGEPPAGGATATGPERAVTAFLFTGQGAQRPGMGAALAARFPVFAEVFAEVAAALDAHLPQPLRGVLDDGAALDRTEYTQPALFAFEVALFRLLAHHGTRPDVVIGHSVGELAAAHAAGVLSLPDAARLVVARGRAMGAARAGGAMVAIGAPEEPVRAALAGYPGEVDIAAVNGPAAVVVSGTEAAVLAIAERFRADGHRTTRLRVSHAFHSPHMDPVLAEFGAVAAEVSFAAPTIPLVSTVTGGLDAPVDTPEYWVGQVRATVRFADAVAALAEHGVGVVAEVGPDAALTPMAGRVLDPRVTAVALSRAGRDEVATFVSGLAAAHAAGAPLAVPSFTGNADAAGLPARAFRGPRFWLAPARATGPASDTAHPLLTSGTDVAGRDEAVYSGTLSTRAQPWLADHRIAGGVLLPATAVLDLALAAGRRCGTPAVAEAVLEAPLVLIEADTRVQVVVAGPDASGARPFTVHADSGSGWTRHASGSLTAEPAPGPGLPLWPPRGAREVAVDYAALADSGYEYGPVFRAAERAWRVGDGFAVEVALPDGTTADGFELHPALLDAVLHPVVASPVDAERIRLPFGWARAALWATRATRLRALITPLGDDRWRLALADGAGAPVGTAELALRPVDRAALPRSAATGGPHGVDWVPLPTPEATTPDQDVVVLPAQPGDAHNATTALLAAVRAELAGQATIVCATRGAVAVLPDEDVPDLDHAPAWGLLRVVQSEYPGRVVLVDTDDELTDDVLAAVLATGEPQVAVREGTVRAPRFARLPEPTARQVFRPEGTVLVTGGTAGLGGLLARHLASAHGVRRLLLTSRRGPGTPGVDALVADLEALGAHVVVRAVDAADRAAMAALLAEHPVTAVVHTAGVLADATVDALTDEQLAAAARPKVDAARVLHELTDELDAFVLFSSISGLLGTAGQAAYAAANTYLDALAAHRRAAGLPATSLAWGLWDGSAGGMGAGLGAADLARWTRAGVPPLSPGQGLDLFDRALVADRALVVPAELVPARVDAADPPALWRGLVRPTRRAAAVRGPVDWVGGLAALPPDERLGVALDLVVGLTAEVLGHDTSAAVDPSRAFKALGFDSLAGLELRNRLAAATGTAPAPTLVFDHPTPAAVAAHLLAGLGEQVRPRVARVARVEDDPVVIVGMACRYPGGVRSPEDLWQLVANGTDAITDFPGNRGWDLDALYHPDAEHMGTSYTRSGGFLHDADLFDASFFEMSPREATATDPQQRLLLETAWEAFEHAGIDPGTLRGGNTGVFVGAMYDDYASRLPKAPRDYEGFLLAGNTSSVISGRIAYNYGFEGPAVTVDTACSSSLVALHLGARALRSGESDLVLVGGATVMAGPSTFIEFSRQRGLSADGRCKSFADAADGTGWSEGVGLLLLERLSDARRLGHQVFAVVRGSAVNSDGASNGLTAPSGPAQERVILGALADANLEPSDVDAVEAHGTGTRLGDPIEARALLGTYGRDRERPLWLGSLKSNIGHAQAAAGVGGIIKVVQAMRHGELPRTLHVDQPSRHVEWTAGAVSLLTEAHPWPAGERARRAGVSSFGISGTNAHVIIEEAPEPEPSPDPTPPPAALSWVLSARDETALRARATRLREHLTAHPLDPVDVAHSLVAGRALLPTRGAVVGTTTERLLAGLDALGAGGQDPAVLRGVGEPGKLALLFTGQGGQRLGMGRELHATDEVFRSAVDEIGAHVDGLLERPLTAVLFAEPDSADAALLDQTAFAQVALFAVETALHRVLAERGVRPDYLLGHSIGEVTAAHAAGVFDLADACALVAARGRLMQSARDDGAMVAVEAAEDEVLAALPHGDAVDIAAVNGPRATVVSGDADAVAAVAAHWAGLGRRTTRLRVSHAFHSAHMRPVLAEFESVVAGLTAHAPTTPVVSNVTGGLATAADLRSPGYWARHVRSTVRFHDGLRTLAELGVTRYVEAGPGGTLAALAEEHGIAAGAAGLAVPLLHRSRPEPLSVVTALTRLHLHGAAPDWSGAHAGARLRPLPTYPFRSERHWLRADPGAHDAAGLGLTGTGHPLLGAVVERPDGALVLTGRIGGTEHAWVADHVIGGRTLLPGTALVEAVLRAGAVVGLDQIDELVLESPLELVGAVRLQVGVRPGTGAREFEVHAAGAEGGWTRHATGSLVAGDGAGERLPVWPPPGAEPVDLAGAYEALADRGHGYGPALRGLSAMWRRGDELFAEVGPVAPNGFAIHPALLDAALHPLVVASDPGNDPLVPFAWSGVRLHRSGADALRVHLSRTGPDISSITVTDGAGTPVFTAREVALRPAAAAPVPVYRLDWVPVDAPGTAAPTPVEVVRLTPGSAREAAHQALAVAQRVLAEEDTHVVVVTSGAVAAGTTPVRDPAAAAAWGLLRTAQQEAPGRITLVDLPGGADDPAPALAVGEPQAAIRDGRVFVPRLVRARTTAQPGGPLPVTGAGASTLGADDPVLVTGATGALGALIARHLVGAHGARRVVLVSRRGRAAPGAVELAADLARAGAEVTVAACDTADRDAVAALLAGLGRAPALVVHAAGVLDDATITGLTPDRLDAVLRPKVDAALVLRDLLTPATRLVLFSSVTGVLGTPGQGNYAAANAFLDALAQHGGQAGPRTTSLAWGLWAGPGMAGALADADRARLARLGVAPLPPADGLALFDAALAGTEAVVIPARLALAEVDRETAPPVLRELLRERPGGRATSIPAPTPPALAELSGAELERAVTALVGDAVAAVLGHDGDVAGDRPFNELGFDSLTAVELRNRLRAATGLPIATTAVFDHPTPKALAGALVDRLVGASAPDRSVPVRLPSETEDDPVVIVGMACRYPGGVRSPEDLWQLVANETDAITDFPTNRGWDLDALYHPDPDHPGTVYVTRGGFLHDADLFDAEFFRMSPREAMATDPQQRLLLETAWEAFEHAGIDPGTLRGSATGVFAGSMYDDYGARLHQAPTAPEGYEGYLVTGSAGSVLSGRVAYTFGLEGPAMTVDTACSSSLVALHLAANALRRGECDLALAGGVTVMATPATFVEFSRQRGLARDGRCKAFGAGADGTGWGEGAGLVVLQRLSAARRDGHRVLAVVRGSAITSDGASNGLTAPHGPAQRRAIRAALADAGLRPSDVDVVEAHGTGTALGDPIEARALLETYGQDRDRPVWLGSLKSNIGHTQAAAGVGGVIKLVQAMRHGVLPRTLHADDPTPEVDWSSGSVALLSRARPWTAAGPRRAAVSSFGISGTNAHVILEQAEPERTGADDGGADTAVAWPLSAHSPAALRAQAARLRAHLLDRPGVRPADVARALAARSALAHRAVLPVRALDDALPRLAALAAGTPAPGTAVGEVSPGRLALLFGGQGGQRVGMARELHAGDPVFAAALDEVCAAFDPHLDRSLRDLLLTGADQAALDRTENAQPALFAVETALLRLITARGLVPDVVLGHSIGGIAAAHAAGVFDLADAATLVAARGALMQALPPGGAMVAVRASEADLVELIGDRADEVSVAAVNAPGSCVLSGTEAAVTAVAAAVAERGGRTKRLAVSHAFHSPMVEPMLGPFREVLAGLSFAAPSLPVVSEVTGALATEAELTDPEYWVRHARAAVRFADGLRALAERGATTFLEVGPAGTLTAPTRETLGPEPLVVPLLRADRPEQETVAEALGTAYTRGAAVRWAPTDGPLERDLPTYAFQSTRFWLDRPAEANRSSTGLGRAAHPLLDSVVDLPDGRAVFSGRVTPDSPAWLGDHRLGDTPVLPATALLDLAAWVGRRLGIGRVEDLALPLPLAVVGATRLRVVVEEPDALGDRAFAVHARAEADETEPWSRCATGTLTARATTAHPAPVWPPSAARPIDLTGAYDLLADAGLGYGPAFRGLTAAWERDGDLFAEVELPATATESRGWAGPHPAVLDAALHVPALLGARASRTRLPFSWSGARISGTARRLRVSLVDLGGDALRLTAVDEAGAVLVEVDSVALRAADPTAGRTPPRLRLDWVPVDVPPAAVEATTARSLHAPPAVGDVPERVRRVTEWLLPELRAHAASDSTDTLLVITGGAVDTEDPDIAGAALWGMVRTAQTEHPGRFALLDIEPGTELTDADRPGIAALLAAGEDQLALRGGSPRVPRLARSDDATATADLSGGTVLITGGTGGLAAPLARHLVARHGVRDLLLAGRRGPRAAGVAELVAELAAAGATARVVTCDVADRDAVRALVDAVPEDKPLRAVVHAAGVVADAPLHAQREPDLRRVLAPKVDAAWHLHEATADLDLAAFVLFSSIAGVVGNAGQANYAAANAALDAVAAHRAARGLPSTSLAWGLWADGMGADLSAADLARLRRGGMAPLSVPDGLALFDAALGDPRPHAVPARLDLSALRRPGTAVPVVLRGLVRQAPATAAAPAADLGSRVAGLSGPEAERVARELVDSCIAQVLGHEPGRVAIGPDKGLLDHGFDSLTALELRNRLGAATGLRLATTLVFDHPTPGALAQHLVAECAPASTAVDPLVELSRLETVLTVVEPGSAQVAEITARLRSALRRLTAVEQAPALAETDDELFQLIDSELGTD